MRNYLCRLIRRDLTTLASILLDRTRDNRRETEHFATRALEKKKTNTSDRLRHDHFYRAANVNKRGTTRVNLICRHSCPLFDFTFLMITHPHKEIRWRDRDSAPRRAIRKNGLFRLDTMDATELWILRTAIIAVTWVYWRIETIAR